ncbi:MAG: ribonuclease H-like domain-containing protein [Candidatus Moranbacteria bacterium]|nr:ribonuclease H-like domain-containing protein [Candidatus Moranbacteria bacterium]
MKRLYLDIETLPAGEEAREILKMLHDKKKKKKTDMEDFEQYLLGTTFDGSFGRILCIGYAINDEPTEVLYFDGDEKKMLEEFWNIAADANLFIGHNIIDFDMRFIFQRSVINGIKPSWDDRDLSFARYRSYPMFDTMREWTKWSMNNIGLEHLALALGIPSPKDGIDGSQVYKFYQEGKVKEICDYCQRDVETTREVYKRIAFIN